MMRTLMRACAVAVVAALAVPAAAQDYPSQPVHIIVPFSAGGPADIYARYLGDRLQQRLGQPFVVENRPGGGGVIGAEAVVQAAPDGYTLLMMSNTHTTNETLIPDKSYELMDDLVPVAPVNFADLVLVVHPSVEAETLEELIALAKERPGELNYASSGPGTPYHMAGELFKAMSETDIVHVPHRGSADARAAVLGGHVQMMLDSITTMVPNIEAGTVRALGVSGNERNDLVPEVPTIDEAGVPGYEATIWLGLMAPAGTPEDVLDKLNEEVRAIQQLDEVRQEWAQQGVTPLIMTRQEFDEYLRADIEKWAEVIRVSGATAQ
ncbi:MAG TPA: tripartite tricarboxylate transporter substrate binding protein [Afifellaceae bacterium]|nr:tripartite tricarboxylate transporter substrate binding protein [Afifellaceae bacterium]